MSNSKTSTLIDLTYKIFTNFDKTFRILAPGFLIIFLLFFNESIQKTLLEINKMNVLPNIIFLSEILLKKPII